MKFRFGLFDHPYADPSKADKAGGFNRNLDFVREIQAQSLVLLKNEDSLLPLDRNKVRRVLVTGPLADESNFMESRYGPNRLDKVTILDGLREYLKGKAEVTYSEKANTRPEKAAHARHSPCPESATAAGGTARHRKARRTGARQRTASDRQLGRRPHPGHSGKLVPRLPGRNGHCRDLVRRAQSGRKTDRDFPENSGTDRAELPVQARLTGRPATGRSERKRSHQSNRRAVPLRLWPELHHL